jgi:hypothetical protein
MRFHRSECDRPAAEESPRRNQIPGWGRQENGGSIRRSGEIPCRRYAGRPGVRRNWPKSCAAQGIREWPPKGSPEKVPVRDFPDPKKGQTTP